MPIDLCLTTQTVKFHVANALERTRLRNPVELARWWWEHVEQRAGT